MKKQQVYNFVHIHDQQVYNYVNTKNQLVYNYVHKWQFSFWLKLDF